MGTWRRKHRDALKDAFKKKAIPKRGRRAFFQALNACPLLHQRVPDDPQFIRDVLRKVAKAPFAHEPEVLRFLLRCATSAPAGGLCDLAQMRLVEALEITEARPDESMMRAVLNAIHRDVFQESLHRRARATALRGFRRSCALSEEDIAWVSTLRGVLEPEGHAWRMLTTFLEHPSRVRRTQLRKLKQELMTSQLTRRQALSRIERFRDIWVGVQLEKASLRQLTRLGDDPSVPISQRLEALLIAGARAGDTFNSLLERVLEDAVMNKDVFTFVLGLELKPDVQEHLLAGVLEALTWTQRRACIRALADPKYTHLCPMLASIGAQADPTTRLALVETFQAIGHLSAEPYLLDSLTKTQDIGVEDACVRALETFGTRLALPALHALSKRRASRDAVARAVDAIEERYPVAARAGSLTLAEGSPNLEGALTELGASAADIELYTSATLELASGAPVLEGLEDQVALLPGGHGQLMVPGWELIPTAPRALPPALYAHHALWGDGVSAAGWGAVLGSIPLLFISSPIGAIVAIVGFVLILGALADHRSTWRVMRDGVPTYGELVERTHEPFARHTYTFRFETATGPQEVQRAYMRRRPEIEDEDQEALMYLESTGEVVLLDELPSLQVSERGQLHVPRPLLLALSAFVVMYVVIAVILGFALV